MGPPPEGDMGPPPEGDMGPGTRGEDPLFGPADATTTRWWNASRGSNDG